MAFSYDRLWILVKEKEMKKTELARNIGITSTTLAKLSKNENVRMDILDKICTYLDCELEDIIEHIPEVR